MANTPFFARHGLKTEQAITSGNSTVNATINSTSMVVGNSTLNTTALSIGSNVSVGTGSIFIGNSTVNVVVNSSSITISGVGIPQLSGNNSFDSGTLFVDSVNDRVGVKNTAPVVSFHITGTDAVFVPAGNTGQRPTGNNGMFRYNTQTAAFEGYANDAWGSIGGGGGLTLSDNTSVNSTFYVTMTSNSTGTVSDATVSTTKLYFNPNTGTLSATSYNSLSDVSFKNYIKPIKNSTELIKSLNGVEFKWKGTKNKSAGMIAQQLEPILPHLVESNHEGVKSINYNGLIAYLIETIKEMDARIQVLEK